MTSSSPARSRARLAGVAVLACAAVGAGVLPLVATGAVAAPGPVAPPLVGPSDAGTLSKEVVLDWAPVAGATGYVVQVGTDDEWSDTPTLEQRTAATRLTLPTSLPHASYVWRVAAVGGGVQGGWSGNGTFTRGWELKPTPRSPFGAVDPAAGVPTFSWSPVPTASEYQLQVSTSPYFDAPFRTQSGVITESCFTTRTTVTPFNGQAKRPSPLGGAGDCTFGLLGTGELRYWRVRPLDHVADDAPEVNTTPVVDEGISSQPPQAADELDTTACPSVPKPYFEGASPQPVGGAAPTPSASPSPSASRSASPSGSPAAGPSAPAPAAPAASPRTPESNDCEPGHKVEKGAWSDGVAFVHEFPERPADVPFYDDLVNNPTAPAGSAASLPMPTPGFADGSCTGAVCRDFPTITWSAVPKAQWYRVYVALDRAFTNVQDIAETPGLSWTPTAQWRESTAGASYYVVVQPCTTSPSTASPSRRPGCDEPSAPAVFRKSSPKLAQAAPADKALLGATAGDVVLGWQSASEALAAAVGGPATSEAHAYRVQVSTPANPDFLTAGLVSDAVVDATHFVSDEPVADGTYLWRVQTVDASGHRLPWSATRSFTKDTTAPRFSATPTVRLGVGDAVTVGFSEPVTGVDGTSVSLSGAPARVTLDGDQRRATVRPSAPLVPGARHVLGVTAAVTDLAGNPSAAGSVPLSVDPVVDDRSPAMGLGGRWQRLAASNAVGGTWSRSLPVATRQTAATVALVGRGAQVTGCVGPGNGVIELWADGVRLTRIDTFRTYSGCGVVLTRAPFRTGEGLHRIQVRGLGVKNARSKGTAVGIDAITAVR